MTINSKIEYIQKLNSFFDKIYVLNLERSSERRKNFIQQTDEELNYSFFKAIDGSLLNYKQLENDGKYSDIGAKKNANVQKTLNLSEIGCALSHLSIYHDMIKNNYKKVLILEDDSYFNEANLKHIKPTLDQLPKNWELIYLGYLSHYPRFKLLQKFKAFYIFPLLNKLKIRKYNLKNIQNTFIKNKKKYSKKYSKNLNLAGRNSGAFGYGISIEAAKKLISLNTPVITMSDIAFLQLIINKQLNAFEAKYPIIYPNLEIDSTIY